MARQIVVLALIFFAIVGMASAAADTKAADAKAPAANAKAADAPAASPSGHDNNVIGTLDGAAAEAAPVGGPVPAGAYGNLSPASSPSSGATGIQVSSVAGVIVALAAGLLVSL